MVRMGGFSNRVRVKGGIEVATRSAPALWGGVPAFPERLPFAKPSIPPPETLARRFTEILTSGVLTNGPYTRELERRVAEYVGVRHCVAVSSCTVGLMLCLRTAAVKAEVIVPSFTFSATAHAIAWNGATPAFADVDEATLTLSSDAAGDLLSGETSAILATHTFGTPCDVEGLSDLARRAGLRLVFDAAHALGASRQGKPVGCFGDAEVFSLSPTKPVVAGEGGLITTDDNALAERCRMGRDYGHPGDYDCRFVGLNGRMSEFHAAIGLASLDGLDDRIRMRNRVAAAYVAALDGVPGIAFPTVSASDTSSYRDFTILVEASEYGMSRDGLAAALHKEGIDTRPYYSPAVHTMKAYESSGARARGLLPVTDAAAARVLSLPMWTEMGEDLPARVAETIAAIHLYSTQSGDDAREIALP